MFSFNDGFKIEGLVKEENVKWRTASNAGGDRYVQQPSLYRKHFYGTKHNNFISYYSPIGPVTISIKLEDNQEMYKILIYTDKGSELLELPKWSVYRTCWRFLFRRNPTPYHIIKCVKPELTNFKFPKIITTSLLQDELLKVYEPDFSKVMKVGLLYCKEGQTHESQMLHNVSTNTSKDYDEFLEFLGDKIELKGFNGYNGGLDVNYGNSGIHSIYNKFNDTEFMFHVSTMLPYFNNDPRQIERKKHIGNDRIMIVFNDGPQPFKPDTMKSKQTQTIILIQPLKDESIIQPQQSSSTLAFSAPSTPPDESIRLTVGSNGYQSPNLNNVSKSSTRYIVSVANRSDVPSYDPPLPSPPIFNKDESFKRFLYEKMINGSSSLRYTPVFLTKTQREKNLVFLNFANKYSKLDNK